ncbi:MAG: HTH domain-containing protein [Halorientalis sp.]
MSSTDSIRLELYVRTLSPPGARGRQEQVIERLQRLEDEGDIDDFYVKVWGRQIDPTTTAAETDQGEFILNRIAEFKQWALANNTTLESFYQTREQSSSITGQDHTTIVLPKMGLAEYRGGELEQVAPCTDGDDVYSVVDHLDALERRVADQPRAAEPAVVAEE